MPEPLLPRRIIGPAHLHWHWLLGYILILAVVPPCAGECRLVRVTGVLIFANALLVLLLCCSQRPARPSRRRPPPDPAGLPQVSKRGCLYYPIVLPALRLLLTPCRNDVP
jgi:hypothetical protein